jgi:hypothetical protein
MFPLQDCQAAPVLCVLKPNIRPEKTMSEFISTCPKCRQQILCETAYIGHRVACPVCMQEITMPTPQPGAGSPQPQSQAPPPNQPQPSASGAKSSSSKMIIIVGAVAVVLVLVVGGVLLASAKGKQPAAGPSSPAAPALGSSAFYTNRLVLDTASSIVEIIEVRQKDAKRCVDAFYHCTQKRTQLELSITGTDAYGTGVNGGLGDFQGWTFKNADYTYFVSSDGHLVVTQGKKTLLSEIGTWTEQNYQLRPPDR